MSKTRPPHVKRPAHWPKSMPAPEPAAVTFKPEPLRDGPDPTRYGDWEKNGIAVDF